MEKLNKVYKSLSKWSNSVPIGAYRYEGHKTIYSTSSSAFRPCEREILIHRYMNRYLQGKFIRFYFEEYKLKFTIESGHKSELVRSPSWQYAYIMNVSYAQTAQGVLLKFSCIIGNTLLHEEIYLKPSTIVTHEFIPEAWYRELINMVQIK